MSDKNSNWSSLDVAKLIVSMLIPASIAYFGLIANETLQKGNQQFSLLLQQNQSEIRLSEAVIEKRKEIYDQIRIPLNNIYCYIEEVGEYKSMTPVTVNSDRRTLHATMHTQRVYWSPTTFALYLKYMDEVAFDTSQGVNVDAVIKDSPGQKKALPSWRPEWNGRFSGGEHPEHDEAYNRLLDAISLDIRANIGR